jgi:L-ascorbate metabolism protein UlaG (beta-lactamase superfamily)
MKLKWLGHSAFLLTADSGARIVTDPYRSGSFDGAVGYGPVREACDAVTVSHDHDDHNAWQSLPGKPQVVRGAGEFTVKGIGITGFDTAHDEAGGTRRGRNTVFRFGIDGLCVLHCGDLGEDVRPTLAKAVGPVDVLLVPVGGHFTIDGRQAHGVAAALGARITIPMHYKTTKLGFPVAGVDDFLRGREGVRRVGAAEVVLAADSLPAEPQIWVLDHAL